MTILAIDPHPAIGWCRSDKTNGIFSTDVYANRGQAASEFLKWLTGNLRSHPTTYLVIMRRHYGTYSSAMAFTQGLMVMSFAAAYMADVPWREVPVEDVHRHLIGRPRRSASGSQSFRQFNLALAAAVVEHGIEPMGHQAMTAAALLTYIEQTSAKVLA